MHFGCSLHLLGVENKDISAALQMLLTEVELSATQAILTVTTLSLNYLLVHDSLSLKSTCTN